MATTSRPVTVFVAEDNPILLQGLARALTAHGYAVESAADGVAFLQLLAGTDSVPDLLLLDVMMPGMTGLEVLQALRADPRWSALPVVLITAATGDALPAEVASGTGVEVLIKPFRLNELLGRIDERVRRSRGSGRSPGGEGTVLSSPAV